MLSAANITRIAGDSVSPSAILVPLVAAAILRVAVFGSWFASPLAGLIVWAVVNYVVEIIEQRADGHERFPPLSIETVVHWRRQRGTVCALVLAVAFCACYWMYARGFPRASQVLAGGLLIILPAALMVLAVSRSVVKAFSPMHLAALAFQVGFDYLLLLLFMGCAAACIVLAVIQLSFATFALAIWVLLIFADAAGFMVFEHRFDLGLVSARSPERFAELARGELLNRRRQVLDRAYGAARAGNLRGGLEEVEEYIDTELEQAPARLWFFHEMVKWSSANAAIQFGRASSAALLQAGHTEEADALRRSCESLEQARGGKTKQA